MDMNTMTASMPSSTMSGSMATSTATTIDGMTMMPASMMQMTFFTSSTTSIWTTQFTPANMGQYAGACIFLIILAFVFRGMFAAKSLLEARWHSQDLNRRYVTVAGKGTEAQILKSDASSRTGTLSVNGVEEDVIVLESRSPRIAPWRLSVEPVRALFVTAIVTVGYLLMLAVMTLNVGYFLSILGGSFLGELVLGRYSTSLL